MLEGKTAVVTGGIREMMEPIINAIPVSYTHLVTDQAKEAMTKDGTFPFDAATVDGELYGIPWVQPRIETCHALFVNEMCIRDRLQEAVGGRGGSLSVRFPFEVG